MKDSQHKYFTFWLFTFTSLAVLFTQSSCGFISMLGKPTSHERKIPAEFNLARRKGQRILILVNQPGWLDTNVNVRYYITEAVHKNLVKKVKLLSGDIISYKELSEFRTSRSDFSSLTPVETGRTLKADIVLAAEIEDYKLKKMSGAQVYEGILNARTAIFETATSQKLWPKTALSKTIKVGFETEGSSEGAADRLANACAHCITRYLYNCPENKFKIHDDRSGLGWQNW